MTWEGSPQGEYLYLFFHHVPGFCHLTIEPRQFGLPPKK